MGQPADTKHGLAKQALAQRQISNAGRARLSNVEFKITRWRGRRKLLKCAESTRVLLPYKVPAGSVGGGVRVGGWEWGGTSGGVVVEGIHPSLATQQSSLRAGVRRLEHPPVETVCRWRRVTM